MRKIWEFIKEWGFTSLVIAALSCVIYMSATSKSKPPEPLKEFKDGIQNHLVWSIKGECFFVRPDTDVTVYLIRVVDCDKK
jgi:hypothetical protein